MTRMFLRSYMCQYELVLTGKKFYHAKDLLYEVKYSSGKIGREPGPLLQAEPWPGLVVVPYDTSTITLKR